jgi:hypothetical protein
MQSFKSVTRACRRQHRRGPHGRGGREFNVPTMLSKRGSNSFQVVAMTSCVVSPSRSSWYKVKLPATKVTKPTIQLTISPKTHQPLVMLLSSWGRLGW